MSHVFVIRGSITSLACDVWMLPTSAALGLRRWTEQVPRLQERAAKSDLHALRTGQALVAELAGGEDEPAIVLTAIPRQGFSDANALVPAVDAFVRAAASLARDRRGADSEREQRRPLLAMPFLGTHGGGGAQRRGEILEVLLDAMRDGTAREQVDCVLVLQDPDAYALAQLKRAKDETFFSELDEGARRAVVDLVPDARSGRLVPFMGAGVSASAGGPTWSELIERLAERVLPRSDAARSLLDPHRDALDQAAALRTAWERLPESEHLTFNGLVAEELRDVIRYGLAPALLAQLPAQEAITLNYDALFETAAADGGSARRVIPRPDSERSEPAERSNERWLLKLHGSVDSPASIVLTREDYLGYEQDRGTLSALVKAMLMTRHLLFVGFGLADDHFHEILHDVRRALAGQGVGALDATVLELAADPLDQLLWNDELRLVPLGSPEEHVSELGRRLEIFLDALICYSSNDHSYLLKDAFSRVLTAAEARLKQLLARLRSDAVRSEVLDTPAWAVVQRALDELGSGPQKD